MPGQAKTWRRATRTVCLRSGPGQNPRPNPGHASRDRYQRPARAPVSGVFAGREAASGRGRPEAAQAPAGSALAAPARPCARCTCRNPSTAARARSLCRNRAMCSAGPAPAPVSRAMARDRSTSPSSAASGLSKTASNGVAPDRRPRRRAASCTDLTFLVTQIYIDNCRSSRRFGVNVMLIDGGPFRDSLVPVADSPIDLPGGRRVGPGACHRAWSLGVVASASEGR